MRRSGSGRRVCIACSRVAKRRRGLAQACLADETGQGWRRSDLPSKSDDVVLEELFDPAVEDVQANRPWYEMIEEALQDLRAELPPSVGQSCDA